MGALIGGGIATLLSLCILSRAIADNPLYRLGQSLLIGTGLGYIAAVLVRNALVPAVEGMAFGTATTEQWTASVIGLVLGLLLLTRYGRQRGSHWANLPLALLFGAGAALALAGAVRGTLVPQLLATIREGGLLPGDNRTLDAQVGTIILALATLITLLAFTYTWRAPAPAAGGAAVPPRRRPLSRGVQRLGRLLILIAFGVFFAATVTTYIAALVGQLSMMYDWVGAFWGWMS